MLAEGCCQLAPAIPVVLGQPILNAHDRILFHPSIQKANHALRIEGAAAYREFWAGFMTMLKGAKLIAAFGDETTALIMYDTETLPVKSAPAAEYLTVKHGKITACRIIFDRAPFIEARQQAAQTQA